MTHEEYVASVRSRIAATAAAMLDHTTPFIEGARLISELIGDADISNDDPDIVPFVVVDSETDALPIGAARKLWSYEVLARTEPDLQAATEWARDVASDACASLVRRFGP